MQNQNDRNKIFTAAALRGAVAAYLVFLGYKIITNQDTEMKPLMSYLLGGAMILAAVFVTVYIVYRLRTDLRTAAEPQEKEKAS